MVFKKRSFEKRDYLILLGTFTIIISFMHIWADFFSAWIPYPNDMETPLSVTFENIKEIYLIKPRIEILFGSLLALLFIPGHLIGTYFVYLGIKQYDKILSRSFLLIGWFAVTIGTGYHYSLAFIGDIVKSGNQQVLDDIIIYWETWGFSLIITYSLAFIILTYIIASGKSLYPRWVFLFSPVITVIILSVFTLLIPENFSAIKSFLVVTGLNGQIFIFYIVAFYILMKKQNEVDLSF